MKLNITAYSTALFSTWINAEQSGMLFDARDGVSAGLLQKSRKVKHVFITHPHRDHLTGLLQFSQLNSREGFPRIYYPEAVGSFPYLQVFQKKFDPHVAAAVWEGIKHGVEVPINKQMPDQESVHDNTKKPLADSDPPRRKTRCFFHNFCQRTTIFYQNLPIT